MFSTPTVCRDCHSGPTIYPQSANGDRSMIHALHWNFIVSVPHTQLTLLSTLTSLIGIKYPRPSLLFLYCKWQKAGRGYKTTSKTSTFKFISITPPPNCNSVDQHSPLPQGLGLWLPPTVPWSVVQLYQSERSDKVIHSSVMFATLHTLKISTLPPNPRVQELLEEAKEPATLASHS